MKYAKNFYQIKSNDEIFEKIIQEKESIGYYTLPFCDTAPIKAFAKTVKQKDIVILGIGGSSLGTYAIHRFLMDKENSKKLHFLESTDPIELQRKIKKIDLEHALFVVISKSGTTIETIAILKYLHSLVEIDAANTICITEEESKLHAFAQTKGIRTFAIPKNVGGRFSAFSNVGLIPLAVVGLDIDRLLAGCREVYESFFDKEAYFDILMEKARFLVENKNRFNINVVFSYSSLLEGFNKWYIQLWGESLGKPNINGTRQALTPVGLIGPIDQHSFLQLIIEGKRDKTVTFIKIEDFQDEMSVPDISLPSLEELDYLNTFKFKDLINRQADATIKAIDDLKDIPYDVITIESQDEYNMGKLMYAYELLTSIVGSFVQIDTYNQPGVEAGKAIFKESLTTRA